MFIKVIQINTIYIVIMQINIIEEHKSVILAAFQGEGLYFLNYKTHFPFAIWEENGGASYSPNVAYLPRWGRDGGGAGSQEAGAGSPLQEDGGGRSGAMPWALGWEEGVSRRCEAREARAESLLRHTVVLGRRVQAVQTC